MAEISEIIAEIDSLSTHCRPPLMSVDEQSRWKADWCSDLREYPIEAIREGCRRWRNGSDRKFPLPGQLRPLVAVAAQLADRRAQGVSDPWAPLSDADYERLSVRDKIRHHRILASEARTKAGPMWRNGRPAAEGDMSDAWRTWRTKAEGHQQEAKRLSEFLKRQENAA